MNRKHQGKKKYKMKFSETKITGEFNAGAEVCDELDKEME